MYEFISGNVNELTPAYAVIVANGLGYYIHISLNTYSQVSEVQKSSENTNIKLFLHMVVREDAHLLYGFYSAHERSVFRLLISVSGIGANTARMILSSHNTAELQKAIAEGNVSLLQGIKGIGLKTAQRIIVDLKDKIGIESTAGEKFLNINNTIKDEALSALVTLGFSKSMVEKFLDKYIAAKPAITVEELIKQALKSM
jgi:Holliday junction DNA helicase RuvA